MLTKVAKVVLKDRFEEFKRLHQQFIAGEELETQDPELLRLLEDGESEEDLQEDDLLWAFAHSAQRIEWIDWSGEEDTDQLKRFVDERLQSLVGVKLDWSFLDEFDRTLDLKKLKRGDYLPKKFSCIDAVLRKKGFLIALLDQGDDQYYPFIASIKEFEDIDGIEIGMTRVLAWADQ